jgi:hypothetical protein
VCTTFYQSPVTTASYHNLELTEQFPPCTRDYTLTQIALLLAEKRRKPQSLSTFVRNAQKVDLNGVTKLYWASLPHADLSVFLCSDILHQLHKFFLDHPFKWLQTLVGEEEMDKRISAVQHLVSLKHFTGGVSMISQWTGAEHRELQKIIIACCAGALNITTRAMKVIRSIVDIIYLAQYVSHSDKTIGYLLDTITVFHKNKSELVDLQSKLISRGLGGPDRKKLGLPTYFRIPKIEVLHNLVPCIHLLSSLMQFTTEITEKLHGPVVKDPFCHGNGKESADGMCRYLDQEEKVQNFQEYLRWRKGQTALLESSEEITFGPTVSSSALSYHFSVKLSYHLSMKLSYHLSVKPAILSISIDDAAIAFSLPDLQAALADFYMFDADLSNRYCGKSRKSSIDATLPFTHINVWYQFRLTPLALEGDIQLSRTIRATPPSPDLPCSHYNTVLVHGNSVVSTSGIEGKLLSSILCGILANIKFLQVWMLCKCRLYSRLSVPQHSQLCFSPMSKCSLHPESTLHETLICMLSVDCFAGTAAAGVR